MTPYRAPRRNTVDRTRPMAGKRPFNHPSEGP